MPSESTDSLTDGLPPVPGDSITGGLSSGFIEANLRRAIHGLPRKLGNYTIKRLINSGGMGSVFEAVQDNPRRVVALKVMRAGMASRSALRRFEYESQILARLRHPGIAQVYEAGSEESDGGDPIPYFVMEYIPNARAINEYAAVNDLPLKETLALFVRVCDAVQHGHGKGIIHRDLKPGNILVDSAGNPKVIDFGVARATDSDMAVTTLQTDVGQLLGTLQWMSPEQVAADPHDLDTRSDVYSLGVVLYELVTGQLPYDIIKSPVYEAARVIREQAPVKPSSVSYRARGDLETILLKALEKDRARRYRSAAELGDDINRLLGDEPVNARARSLVYDLRKFAQRNRALFAVLMVIGAALIITSLFMFASARTALAAARNAQSKARVAEEVTVLLGKVVRLDDQRLAADREGGERELADIASRLEGPFPLTPAIVADIHLSLARGYTRLEDIIKAGPHAAAALREYEAAGAEPKLPEVVSAREITGLAARASGDGTAGGLRLRQAYQGAENRADLANNYAVSLIEAGDLRNACILLRRALESAPNAGEAGLIAGNLALARLADQDTYEAELLCIEHDLKPVGATAAPFLGPAPFNMFAVVRVDGHSGHRFANLHSALGLGALARSRAMIPAAAAAGVEAAGRRLFGEENEPAREDAVRDRLKNSLVFYESKHKPFDVKVYWEMLRGDKQFKAQAADLETIRELLKALRRLPMERDLRAEAIDQLCDRLWPRGFGASSADLIAIAEHAAPAGSAFNHWSNVVNDQAGKFAHEAALQWSEDSGVNYEDPGMLLSIRGGALTRLGGQDRKAARTLDDAAEKNGHWYRGGARQDKCLRAMCAVRLSEPDDARRLLDEVQSMTAPRMRSALDKPTSADNDTTDDQEVALLYTEARALLEHPPRKPPTDAQ